MLTTHTHTHTQKDAPTARARAHTQYETQEHGPATSDGWAS